MPWTVSFSEEFELEFDELPQEVQDAILARALILERRGHRSVVRMPTPLRGRNMRT